MQLAIISQRETCSYLSASSSRSSSNSNSSLLQIAVPLQYQINAEGLRIPCHLCAPRHPQTTWHQSATTRSRHAIDPTSIPLTDSNYTTSTCRYTRNNDGNGRGESNRKGAVSRRRGSRR